VLLTVRARGVAGARRSAWQLAQYAQSLPLSSMARGRLRSGAPMTANLRVFLWVLLGMALFVNYQTWLHDYPAVPESTAGAAAPPPPATRPPTAAAPSTPGAAAAPGASAPGTSAPGAATPGSTAVANAPPTASAAPAIPGQSLTQDAAARAGTVHVRTDVLD